MPAVVSFAASAVLWQWIYRPGQGIVDYLLQQVGITGPAWLSNGHTALPALDIVSALAFTNGSFDLVKILTQGGPINATITLIYYIYYIAFDNLQIGYAAALSALQVAMFAWVRSACRCSFPR